MRLDEVSTGPIYVDTNVLYMYLRADPDYLVTVKAFFRRVIDGKLDAFVSVPVLDELYYRLLLARIRDTAEGNPLDLLRNDVVSATEAHSYAIETAMRKLVTLPHLRVVGLEPRDADRMLENIRMCSLLPRDALHVAVVQRLGLRSIASDDRDFDRVEGMDRHWIFNTPVK